jgi:hypothetical protein
MCLQFGFVIFWQKDLGAKAAHKMLVKLTPGPSVIKHFSAVIYCHSKVILSFCVIKKQCLGNYCGNAVNYLRICETNWPLDSDRET